MKRLEESCWICGEECWSNQKLVEVKTRISGEWRRAHLSCARNSPEELDLLKPRLIRNIRTTKLIKPHKVTLNWGGKGRTI